MVEHWVNEIPVKITAVKRRESKLKPRQGIALTLGIILGVIVPLVIIDFCTQNDNMFYNIMGTAIGVTFELLDLRIVLMMFFNEKVMYEQYQKMHIRPVFKFSDFWDILFIDKNGLIITQDKESGSQSRSLIIKMERTNTIGRPPESENLHYASVTLFIQKLFMHDYRIRRYNLAVNDTNEDKFKNIENRLKTISNIKLKNSMNDILNYNRDFVRDKQNRTIEYYMITSSGARDNLVNDVDEALEFLATGTIYKPIICRDKELNEFFRNVSKLRILGVDDLIKGNLPSERVFEVESVEANTKTGGIFEKTITKEDMAIEKYNRLLQSLKENE